MVGEGNAYGALPEYIQAKELLAAAWVNDTPKLEKIWKRNCKLATKQELLDVIKNLLKHDLSANIFAVDSVNGKTEARMGVRSLDATKRLVELVNEKFKLSAPEVNGLFIMAKTNGARSIFMDVQEANKLANLTRDAEGAAQRIAAQQAASRPPKPPSIREYYDALREKNNRRNPGR